MIRYRDTLSMKELAKRFIAVALHACTPAKLRNLSKRRVILVKPKATFQSYVESRKFGQLMKILKNQRLNFRAWLPDNVVNAENGESALHLILKNSPPVEIVELLIQRLKQIRPESNPVAHQDAYGMTPLHVAVARSCDVRIIELLVFGNGTSADADTVAGIADCHHRYPLHYICTIPTRLQKNTTGSDGNTTFSDDLRIIGCLVISFPAAIDSPDKNGWTPKHMAESLSADEKVLEILRNPSREFQRCQKNVMKHSSVITPTTSHETEALGLPIDEIICYRANNIKNDSDYDDDVSTIGWNVDRNATSMSSNRGKSTNLDGIQKQVDIVFDLSMNEIKFDVPKFKKELSVKYRFI